MIKTDALIIGAGPTGLFTAHQLKLIGLNCEIVDNLDKIGGQCIELYPDKPIYDIPAIPECTGEELTNNLIKQLENFNINFHLGERVDEVKKDLRKSRDLIFDRTKKWSKIHMPYTNAAFYSFFKVNDMEDSIEFAKYLIKKTQVGLAPGIAFGKSGEGHLRLCFAADENYLTEILNRLEKEFL